MKWVSIENDRLDPLMVGVYKVARLLYFYFGFRVSLFVGLFRCPFWQYLSVGTMPAAIFYFVELCVALRVL